MIKIYLSPDIAETGYLPNYATPGSAGIDIPYLSHEINSLTGTILVKTGVHVEIPKGYFGLLTLRSSTPGKYHVFMRNPGIIDSDYRGEILIPLNQTVRSSGYLMPKHIAPGERLAQLIIIPVVNTEIDVVSSLDDLNRTERGTGGFGSTGVN